MGKFCLVFWAYVLNCLDVNLFRENIGSGPLLSRIIFLTAVLFLLWDLELYPSSLRKLWRCGAVFVEFILTLFVMEHIMTDFFYPLEVAVMALPMTLAEYEKKLLTQGGYDSDGIFSYLARPGMCIAASYMLSIFFLLAVLHATRIIDLRLLSCGIGVFTSDIVKHFKKFKKKVGKVFSWRKPKSRPFKCCTIPSRPICGDADSTSGYDCFDDDESDVLVDDELVPTSRTTRRKFRYVD